MPRTVLLADDSVTIQKVVGISFANEDVELITVDNGDDALERTRSCRPDVVLADVVMPGLDGYRLCEAIKSDPALRHIPVLLLAGTFEAFDEERARAAGAAGHVTKPFEAQALVDRVKQLLASPPPAAAPSFEDEPGIARTVEMPIPEALRIHRETTGATASTDPPAAAGAEPESEPAPARAHGGFGDLPGKPPAPGEDASGTAPGRDVEPAADAMGIGAGERPVPAVADFGGEAGDDSAVGPGGFGMDAGDERAPAADGFDMDAGDERARAAEDVRMAAKGDVRPAAGGFGAGAGDDLAPGAGDGLAPDAVDSAFDFFEEDLTSPGRPGAGDTSGDSLEAFDFGAPDDATFAGLADADPGEEAGDDGLGELLDEQEPPPGDTHFGIDTDSLLGHPPDADLVASAPPELDARPPAPAAADPAPPPGAPPGARAAGMGETGSPVGAVPSREGGAGEPGSAFADLGAEGDFRPRAGSSTQDPLGALGAEELSRETALDPDPSGSFAVPADDAAFATDPAADAAASGSTSDELSASGLDTPPGAPFEQPGGEPAAADDLFADDLFAPETGPELETVVDPGGETSTPLVDAVEVEPRDTSPAGEGASRMPPAGGPAFRQEIHDTLEKIAWEAFADVSEQVVRRVVERVEAVAWEVIPQMAETLIREEIRRLKGEPEQDA